MSPETVDVQTSETGKVNEKDARYQEVVSAIERVVDDFNSTAGDGKKVDFAALIARIREMGGTDAESISQLTEGDLIECGMPRLRARQAVQAIRAVSAGGTSGGVNALGSGFIITRDNASGVSLETLVAAFNPRDPGAPAAIEIKRLTGNKPCIVYDLDDGGGIHRKLTVQIIQELIDGEPARESVKIRGCNQPIFRVGEQPPRFSDEHPLFRGERLRQDGTCNLELDWRTGISKEKRVLVHLAVHKTREILVSDNDRVREIHNILRTESADEIRGRYPKADVLYSRLLSLAGEEALPVLKVRIPRTGTTGAGSDPFFGNRSTQT